MSWSSGLSLAEEIVRNDNLYGLPYPYRLAFFKDVIYYFEWWDCDEVIYIEFDDMAWNEAVRQVRKERGYDD